MFRSRDHQMAPLGSRVQGNALLAVIYLDIDSSLAHPHLLPHILPRHRVAATLPEDVRIARHFAQFVIGIRVRLAPI